MALENIPTEELLAELNRRGAASPKFVVGDVVLQLEECAGEVLLISQKCDFKQIEVRFTTDPLYPKPVAVFGSQCTRFNWVDVYRF
jgi:hypothetical protein